MAILGRARLGRARPLWRTEESVSDEHRPLLTASGDEGPRLVLDYVDEFIFESKFVLAVVNHRSTLVRKPSRAFRSLFRFYFALGNYSFLNLLLPVVPCAIGIGASNINDKKAIVWLNYLALLALPGTFRYGSEVLSATIAHYGTAPKLLWNALFGVFTLDLEAVIIALCYGHLELVQAYIVGKIVANCLLTLGICFCVAGMRRSESHFNERVASTLISLLFTAAIPLGILLFGPSIDQKAALTCSRATSFVLLILYGLYLLFRYRTHANLHDEEIPEDEEETTDWPEIRSLGVAASIAMLIGTPVLTYFCSMSVLTALGQVPHLSYQFVGFCLMPLLAEAAEPQIIWPAYTDHMSFVLELAAGTGVQMALFTAPMLCLLGWALSQPLTLRFEMLETVALFTSIWIFGLQVWAGRSNYLSGAQSIAMYIVLCLAVYLS